MSQRPSQHPNYDDAATALIELAGQENNHEKVAGAVSQTAASVKPSPSAVAAANRFPGKLMAVLNSDAYKTIITWSPDGRSFIFLDSNSFERVVLPSIFKVAKFDSFLRKLYRWGFSKCQTHSKVGCPAYKHERFIRDRPDLITDLECRSKPKTQYGNAVPMTLHAFHQSAPELGGRNKEQSDSQSHLLNATWDRAWNGNESTKRTLEQSDLHTMNRSSSSVTNHTNPTHHQSSGNEFSTLNTPIATIDDHQRNIMEVARAAILGGQTFQNANIQTVTQQILANRQAAASMGYSLIGNGSGNTLSDLSQQQSFHDPKEPRTFTVRSKTTPSNMKFMGQSNANANFTSQAENHMVNVRNDASGFFSTDSSLGYQQRNPFLEQMNLGRSPYNIPNVHNNIDPSTGSIIDPMVAAELQAMRMHQEYDSVRNANLIPDLQMLRLLQLNGGRTHLNDEFTGNLQFQNQIGNLLQSGIGDRIQLQNELDRLRQEIDLQLQNQNTSAREFLEKLAQNGKQFFGP